MAAPTEITVIEEVKGNLVKMERDFAAALPDYLPPDKFIRVAQTAITMNPSLAQCEKATLYTAFLQCAQDGLIPDSREAAIVPFAGKAKYMPMVGGICKRIRNSGEISVVDALVVYEKDHYEAWTDEKGPHFKHRKAGKDRGKPICTYAYAIGKDGGVFFEEIDEEDMAEIKKIALSKLPVEKQKGAIWNGPFEDEMRRKSALRRLGKYRLPNSADLDSLFKRDDDLNDDPDPELKPETVSAPTRLGSIIEAQAEVVEEPKKAAAPAPVAKPEPVKTAPPPAAKKPDNPPKKTGVVVNGLEVVGKIEDLKVKDGEGKNGPWRRFAIKVGGKLYGTFDEKIGLTLPDLMDKKQDVKVVYSERKDGDSLFRDIISVSILEETDEPAPSDVPI